MRAAGAVPATIGVLDGEIRVGLGPEELERFTPGARKLGPRDLAACAAQGGVGATTVGGTLAVARAAAIRFLGTGGIGGVHRGYPSPPDVSADLVALVSAPVLVACSGAKSLLDIPATMEYSRRSGSRSWDSEQARSRSSMQPRAGPARGPRRERSGGGVRGSRALGTRRLRPPAREPARGEHRRLEPDRGGSRRGRNERSHGQAMTPFVLSFLHERSDGRTRDEPQADRRQRRARGRGRGSVRRAVSLYANVRDLPVEIEGYELEGLELQARPDFLRRTTVVHLEVAARKASART